MLSARVLPRSIRLFATTAPRQLLFGNLFGSREAKNKEIIEKQDEYEVDPSSKITILSKENSPGFKPFTPEEAMPDFKINFWKDRIVRAQDIEGIYSAEKIEQAINETYQEVAGSAISVADYKNSSLADLQLRFRFAKALQKKLGFDIKDHTITRAHDVDYMYQALKKVIAHRWSSERNPNAIVLRPEDFKLVLNVYLNSERSEEQQEKLLKELAEKALAANQEPARDQA